MSTAIPYHLRTNKNVERALFMELLRRVGPHLPVDSADYSYVGMGGPLLEDFSAVQSVFGCKKMISLEKDDYLISRQKFNCPNCRVDIRHQTVEDFLNGYPGGGPPMVTWFDYTKPDWSEQLEECSEMLGKLPDYSIFKVSLAVIMQPLNPTDRTVPVLPFRLARLAGMFGAFGPFVEDDITEANFPLTLFRIFKKALALAIPDSPGRVCRPLAAYFYNDRTQMVTITVIVGPAEGVKNIKVRSNLKAWPYSNLRWAEPMNIDIPELSIRERLQIEKLLPDATPMAVHGALKIRFDEELVKSREFVRRFIKFAKHVPYFIKMHP